MSLKWIWKPWNDEVILLKDFGRWIWLVNDMVNFDKTDGWFECDTFPIFEYPHNTLLWVGLNWKFMHLSMGSLWTSIIGVMPRLPPLKVIWCEMRWIFRPKPCAVPRLTVCLHWEAKLMGRGTYTRVCKWKVMVDDPSTELRWFRVIPDGCNQMLWHKCATSAECKSIRIAVSTVTDGWKGHTVFGVRRFSENGWWMEWWLDLNHNWVVGMTLMFPLELDST